MVISFIKSILSLFMIIFGCNNLYPEYTINIERGFKPVKQAILYTNTDNYI
jgi:hypothetical protein